MLEIKITGETPLQALACLTAFGLHCLADKDVHNAANRILEAERAKEREEAATEPQGVAATEPSAAANTTTLSDLPPEPYVEDPPHGKPRPTPEPTPTPEDQPKAPALEVVRAKGLEAAQKYGKPAVKAILESFGVPSMTNLAEGDRATFLVKLEALEGQGDGNGAEA